MSTEAEHRMVAAFNIDDGELENEKPEAVFVLGVEYGQVFTLSGQVLAFNAMVHEENKDRIECLLVTRGRAFSITPDDFGFVVFKVAAGNGDELN